MKLGRVAAAFTAFAMVSCAEDEAPVPQLIMSPGNGSPTAADGSPVDDGRSDLFDVLSDAYSGRDGDESDVSGADAGGAEADGGSADGSAAPDVWAAEDGTPTGDGGSAPDGSETPLDATQTGDGGTPDGGTPDGGTPDGGTPDGGTPDAGTPDGGTPDGGTPDAGTPDGGTPDAGTPDVCADPANSIVPEQAVIDAANGVIDLLNLAAGKPTNVPDLIDQVRQALTQLLKAQGYTVTGNTYDVATGPDKAGAVICKYPANSTDALSQYGPQMPGVDPTVDIFKVRLLKLLTPNPNQVEAQGGIVAFYAKQTAADGTSKFAVSFAWEVFVNNVCDSYGSIDATSVGQPTVLSWSAADGKEGVTVLFTDVDAKPVTSWSTEGDKTTITAGANSSVDSCNADAYQTFYQGLETSVDAVVTPAP